MSALRRTIRDAGREPVQRSTRYDVLRVFADGDADGDALDALANPDEAFGNYEGLTRDGRFRFHLKRPPRDA